MLPALLATFAVFFLVLFIISAIGVLYNKIKIGEEEKNKNDNEAVAQQMELALEDKAKIERLELEMLKGDLKNEKGEEKEKEDGS